MYVHDKNKKFALFLKLKANGADIEEQCDASTDEAESDKAEPTQRKFVRVFDTKRSQEIKETSDRSSNLHKNHKRLLTQLGETRLIWNEWKEQYDIENYTDVTHQYLTMH